MALTDSIAQSCRRCFSGHQVRIALRFEVDSGYQTILGKRMRYKNILLAKIPQLCTRSKRNFTEKLLDVSNYETGSITDQSKLLNESYKRGQIAEREVGDAVWKNFFQGKLTYLHWNKGEEMVPTIGGQGGTLLVRKLPAVNPYHVFIGDVVVLKDPENRDINLVRRLAATEGYEMVSTDEKEEPFVLGKDQCWVLSDNEKLKPKEACDSRICGPVPMSNIVGRVIYYLKTAVDHGPVQNSHVSMRKDSSILEVELDVEEMVKNHKA